MTAPRKAKQPRPPRQRRQQVAPASPPAPAAAPPARRTASPLGDGIEVARLNILDGNFGIGSARVGVGSLGVYLSSIGVSRNVATGQISLRFPRVISRSGRDFGQAYFLQPETRRALEDAFAALWARIDAAGAADGAR